jgi:CelD/BcsL family acetyltransferase involved in cellulose biosynthesis
MNDELCADWDEIRQSTPSYRSPFFGHQFIRAVAAHVPEVKVACLQRGGRTVAILPFQPDRNGGARPVGLGINDAHGLLTKGGGEFGIAEFLKGSGLKSYQFHATPIDLKDISENEFGRTRSFLADLTVDPLGYEHYLRTASSTIDRQGQKSRKLARQLGPLRFEFDCRDPRMLRFLIDLKCNQYRRTHIYPILAVDWIQNFLHQLFSVEGESLRGLLSVLYAGHTPVAAHFGMLDGDLLHYWFPVFETEYSYGSPGTQLFLDVARSAAAAGVRSIDLGYGEQAYKHKLTNVVSEMSFGAIDPNSLRRLAVRTRLQVKSSLKQWGIKDRIKPWIRRIYPEMGRGNFEA